MAQTKTKVKDLTGALWNASNVLRNKMNATEYNTYLLSFIFYKYLSDKQLMEVDKNLREDGDVTPFTLEDASKQYQEIMTEQDDMSEALHEALQEEMGFVLHPDLTFTALVASIHQGTFQLEQLQQALRDIETSGEVFKDLFSDVDLRSTRLGPNMQKQNKTVADVLLALDGLNLAQAASGDVLGDAYEYMISQFAADSGKKAGEFYTPHAVSELMTRLALHGRTGLNSLSLYDATMGSGSLLLHAKKYVPDSLVNKIHYYGQELNTSTFNLARMNMILHNVPHTNQQLNNGDTLADDWPGGDDGKTTFDAVLMNPPYSASWSAAKGFLQDPRFSDFGGKLAPKSKADFAFLQHGFHHLDSDGTMAIVLPHGVLFRGNAEGTIRQSFLEKGYIDAVIGLPGGIFYNTPIPTVVLILKKNRTTRDVLFIDASEQFEKQKAQNVMKSEHIEAIFDAYTNRQDVDKFAHVASFDEIKDNDFNLNIPRYVDTFEEEEPVDMASVGKEMDTLQENKKTLKQSLFDAVSSLQYSDDNDTWVQGVLEVFKDE